MNLSNPPPLHIGVGKKILVLQSFWLASQGHKAYLLSVEGNSRPYPVKYLIHFQIVTHLIPARS